MTASVSTRACPQCNAPIDYDERFSEWCPGCEWNLDTPRSESPRAVRRRERERERAERLHAGMDERSAPQRLSPALLAASLLGGLVHLGTLAIAAASVWLLATGRLGFVLLGLVGLSLTYLLRPRFTRLRNDSALLSRQQAPELYALADRVAGELGVRPPDWIRVTAGYRSGYRRVGLRQEVELTVGMALWTALGPQERIALLGRELGHDAVRSPRRGRWLRIALDTLDAWLTLLLPDAGDELMASRIDGASRFDGVTYTYAVIQLTAGAQRKMLDGLATRLLLVCAQPVRLARLALHRLLLPDSQRAEYLADDLAARVGSSSAAATMLDALLLDQVALAHLVHQQALAGHGAVPRPPDIAQALWSGLADYVWSVPTLERERQRRLAARRLTAVDAWHPPTYLRLRRQTERPGQQAAVPAETVDWSAIHAELEDSRWRTAIRVLGL